MRGTAMSREALRLTIQLLCALPARDKSELHVSYGTAGGWTTYIDSEGGHDARHALLLRAADVESELDEIGYTGRRWNEATPSFLSHHAAYALCPVVQTRIDEWWAQETSAPANA